jgi:hypothetical protein
MKVLRWSAGIVVLLALAGCGTSTGPDGVEEPTFPDIPDLVVFYEFDGNLENATSDENHATADRAVTYVEDRHGTSASAVYVDGETIRVSDHPNLDITSSITLATWIRPEPSDHAYNAVIDKNYEEAYSLGLDGGTVADTVAVRAYVADHPIWMNQLVPYGTETWSHVVFTFVDSTGRAEVYLNGVSVGGENTSATLGTCDKDLRIGVAYHGDRYKGAIDQVAIFDRALSAAEVGELFVFE